MLQTLRLLLVTDDDKQNDLIANQLQKQNFHIIDKINNRQQAEEQLKRNQGRYDVALIDLELEDGRGGLELLQFIKSTFPKIEVILFTNWGEQLAIDALHVGAYTCLSKPYHVEELAHLIRMAAEHTRTRQIYQHLADVSALLNATPDLSEVLRRTCQVVIELFNVDHSGIVLFSADRSEGSTIAEYPQQEPSTVGMRIPVKGIPAEECLVYQQEILNIPDVAGAVDLGSVKDMLQNYGICSILIVPVVSRGRTIASFSLDALQEQRSFSPEEIELCKTLANQVAVAIQNSEYIQVLKNLQQATEAMAQAETPIQVLQQIVQGARKVLAADYALIWSYDQSGDTFPLDELVSDGFSAEWLNRFKEEEPHPGRTTRQILSNGYLKVNDLTQERPEHISAETAELLTTLEVRSFQGIRLEAGGDILGVLYVDYRQPSQFDKEEYNLLKHFADYAALALRKTRTLEKFKRAWEAARVVTRVSSQGNLKVTLQAICDHVHDLLGCDIATVYAFDEERQRFVDFAGVGANVVGSIVPPEKLAHTSSVWRILELPDREYHYAENASQDEILNGGFVRSEGVISSLGLQLHFRGHCMGVMFINYRKQHHFHDDEIQISLQFGGQASLAIHNALLREQHARQTQVLSGLYQASQVSSLYNTSLEESLQPIVDQALKLLADEGETCGCFSHLALLEGDKLRFVVAAPRNYIDLLRGSVGEIDLKQSKKIGIVGRTVLAGKTQNIGEVSTVSEYIQTQPGIHSQLSVLLRSSGRVFGVLSVEHLNENAFDVVDERSLEMLALQAGVMIQNARHFFLIQELLKVGKTVFSEGGLFPALEELALTIKKVFACDLVSIYTYDATENEISYPSILAGELFAPEQQTDVSKVLPGKRLPFEELGDQSAVRRLITSGESRFITTSPGDPILGAGGFVVREKILSSAGVVLRVEDEVVGVIFLNYRSTHNFSAEEQNEIQLFANQAGFIIRSARQYEELRKARSLVGGLTALAWTGRISGAMMHKLQHHAINIKTSVSLLKRALKNYNLPQEERDQAEKRLNLIAEQANMIIKEQKKQIPSLEHEKIQTVYLNDLVRERINQLQNEWDSEFYHSIDFQWNLSPLPHKVRGNTEFYRYALDILLDNARQAMQDSPERIIKVTTQYEQHSIVLLIQNSGRGIPEAIQRKLFKEPIQKQEGDEGSGIGLQLAQALIETFGGNIKLIESNPGKTIIQVRFVPIE